MCGLGPLRDITGKLTVFGMGIYYLESLAGVSSDRYPGSFMNPSFLVSTCLWCVSLDTRF